VSACVIVVNWNGRQWLEGCFKALRQQTRPADEVVLVDNGSTDGSLDYVRATFPEVKVVVLEGNRGFAGGNNAGAAATNAEFLVFLNNDTRPDAGWLDALIRSTESDASVGLATSRIVYLDSPSVIDSAGDGYLRVGGAFKHAHGSMAAGAGPSREVFGACGAAFAVRRTVFEELEGFDEDFFMVYEDVDLSYRARLRGWRVVYAHDAIVEHAGSASMGRASDSAVFFGQRNLEWAWLKNSPNRLLWRSAFGHVAYDIAALGAYARRGQLGVWLRAKWSALRGLKHLLAKRKAVQQSATADPEALWALMDPDWMAVKRREKQFDFAPQPAPRP